MTDETKGDGRQDAPVRARHHLWCNYFHRPVEGCKMCEGLWEKYPYDDEAEARETLHEKHFPGVIKVEGT